MSDSAYLGLGCVAFLVTLGLQYEGWRRLLRTGIRSEDAAVRRRALRRWATFAAAFEVVLLALVVGYAVAIGGSHPSGFAWVVPPLGALLGSSVPLQTAAVAITRAGL